MSEATATPDAEVSAHEVDVVVVGAGFAGLYMLHFLRQRGFRVQVLEAGDDVGGTWYWNRYPGARCDIDSVIYSFSFDHDLEQEWTWPHRFAYQPDILRYAQEVADRFDLRRDIRFETCVASAVFDEAAHEWTLTTEDGARFVAPICVMATGCLSVPKVPDIPGIGDFAGPLYETYRWPHEDVDFTGQRVGVIGTGSSGIQCIPVIAKQARHLTVFQRTPNFSVPSWNTPLSAEREAEVKRNYAALREKARNSICADILEENRLELMRASAEEGLKELERAWASGGFDIQYAFGDLFTDDEANEIAAEFARDKIRQIVRDPEVAAMLCPTDHPFGTKRLCVDDAYYETFNRDNVTLVDIRADPIERVTADAVETAVSRHEIDALVLATGFDAMTGALTRIDIRGRDGHLLRDVWADGPRTYLGLAVAGFPNLFTITGPGSPSVLTNMIIAIEQHVEWVGACLEHMRANGITEIEATEAAQDGWVDHVNETADATLFPKANSWYVGANVPGKSRVFMPFVAGFKPYKDICDDVTAKAYDGFDLTATHPKS